MSIGICDVSMGRGLPLVYSTLNNFFSLVRWDSISYKKIRKKKNQ